MKLKIKLGLVAISCIIIMSLLAINRLQAEILDSNDLLDTNTDVILVGGWYTSLNCYPGTVSGSCVVISQFLNMSDNLPGCELFIDGEFFSVGVSRKSIFINDEIYAGFLFDEWNTTVYENGIHELQIFGENGELLESLFVFVKN